MCIRRQRFDTPEPWRFDSSSQPEFHVQPLLHWPRPGKTHTDHKRNPVTVGNQRHGTEGFHRSSNPLEQITDCRRFAGKWLIEPMPCARVVHVAGDELPPTVRTGPQLPFNSSARDRILRMRVEVDRESSRYRINSRLSAEGKASQRSPEPAMLPRAAVRSPGSCTSPAFSG